MPDFRPDIEAYLKERSVKIDTKEVFDKYSFVLVNKYNDHWFWNLDLLGAYLHDDISVELHKYFSGVRVLPNIVSSLADIRVVG